MGSQGAASPRPRWRRPRSSAARLPSAPCIHVTPWCGQAAMPCSAPCAATMYPTSAGAIGHTPPEAGRVGVTRACAHVDAALGGQRASCTWSPAATAATLADVTMLSIVASSPAPRRSSPNRIQILITPFTIMPLVGGALAATAPVQCRSAETGAVGAGHASSRSRRRRPAGVQLRRPFPSIRGGTPSLVSRWMRCGLGSLLAGRLELHVGEVAHPVHGRPRPAGGLQPTYSLVAGTLPQHADGLCTPGLRLSCRCTW